MANPGNFCGRGATLWYSNPLLSPNNFAKDHLMKTESLITDVTAVGSPGRAKRAILGVNLAVPFFGRFRTYLWSLSFFVTCYLSIYLCTLLSVYLSISLSLYLSIFLYVYLSLYLSVYLSISLPTYPSISSSVCLSVCPYIYLSVCLTACLPFYLSVCPSICLSICLYKPTG